MEKVFKSLSSGILDGGAILTFTKKNLYPLFFMMMAACVGCKSGATDVNTWSVLFVSLPESVLLENIEDFNVAYIIKQTHEPLFRQEDGQNFNSRVLANWSRNINYTEYKFCPNTALSFNEHNRFSLEFLSGYLGNVTGKYSRDFQISKEKSCVVVRFPLSQFGYLHFLTKYSNAPSIMVGMSAQGLGAFRVKTISKESIVLARKESVENGYNTIEIYPYVGQEDNSLRERGISDFNMLSSFQQPKWIVKEYRGVDIVQLRAVSLAINHPNVELRRQLCNCINIDEFRRAVITGRKDFYDIKTVLPVGVPGSKGGRPTQVCTVLKGLKGTQIVFANHRTNNLKQLAAFAVGFLKKTGIKIIIKQYSPKEMSLMLFDKKRPKPYNMVVAVAGNPNPEQDEFFSAYAGDNSALDHVPTSIRQSFRNLQQENSPDKKRVLAENLAKNLASQGLVLPLYQTTATMYYPPEIKNLNIGRGFLEAPDVGDFRW